MRRHVISETTRSDLDELMRFRHFRRYYTERRYKRDRMSILEATFLRSLDSARGDLREFGDFLEELAHRMQ